MRDGKRIMVHIPSSTNYSNEHTSEYHHYDLRGKTRSNMRCGCRASSWIYWLHLPLLETSTEANITTLCTIKTTDRVVEPSDASVHYDTTINLIQSGAVVDRSSLCAPVLLAAPDAHSRCSRAALQGLPTACGTWVPRMSVFETLLASALLCSVLLTVDS